MPRTGGIYNAPAGSKGTPNTTIQSVPYNGLIDDLVQDANAPRPLTAGGTNATNATDARTNLGALAAADLLAAPTKAVPVDNDGVVVTDSEDSGKIKRVLWSVVKAFFDKIYQPILSKVTYLELNSDTTVNADVAIDLHSSAGVDFNARLRRANGVNGAFEITQTGTGLIDIYGSGGIRLQGATGIVGDLNVTGAVNAIRTFNVKAAVAAESSHLYLLDETGAVRGIVYATNSKSVRIASNGGTQTFEFATNGTFIAPGTVAVANGAAYLNTDGNVYGPRWQSWGSPYAFDATNARIEQRAQDWANARASQCVQDSRMAGEINVYIYVSGSQFNDLHNSGYVLTRVWHDARDSLNFGSRQPQLYIPNRGWFAAFNY